MESDLLITRLAGTYLFVKEPYAYGKNGNSSSRLFFSARVTTAAIFFQRSDNISRRSYRVRDRQSLERNIVD